MNCFSNILPFESVMLSKWEMASLTVKEKNKSVCVGFFGLFVATYQS